MSATPVIRTAGLTKVYGTTMAVDHLDLEIAAGEVFGLLGPNGAGKTTTILMLLGLTEPTEGTAEVTGLDPARHPLEVKRQVGYLPDNVGFYGTLTGRQNLRFTARLNGIDGAAADHQVARVLDEVGLTYAADQRVDTYSRGMRQRLGIADALVKEPRIVVLDEPTIAIDPEGVVEILRLIRGLADAGTAVLLSSHQLYQVEAVCDRVGIFVAGRLIAEGTTGELADHFAAAGEVVDVTVDPIHDPQAVTAALQGIDGVTTVEPHPTATGHYVVTADADVRPALLRALVGTDVGVLGMTRREAALDEIYRRYFEEAQA